MAAMDKTNSRTGSLCIGEGGPDAASSQTHLLQGYAAVAHHGAHGNGAANGHGGHGTNGDSLSALARRTNSQRNRSLRLVGLKELLGCYASLVANQMHFVLCVFAGEKR